MDLAIEGADIDEVCHGFFASIFSQASVPAGRALEENSQQCMGISQGFLGQFQPVTAHGRNIVHECWRTNQITQYGGIGVVPEVWQKAGRDSHLVWLISPWPLPGGPANTLRNWEVGS